MANPVRETLNRVCNGGLLLGVDAFRSGGDPNFVTAIRLWFSQYRVTFLAVAEADELTAECGDVAIEDEGEWVDVSGQPGWSECIGAEASWVWAMTNQQGYTDAARIEFDRSDGHGFRVVEFVVVASALRFFQAREF